MALRIHPPLWAGVALVAAVAPWLFVIRTIERAQPVTSLDVRATAVVWADRVFASPSELGTWLRSRGASYDDWAAAHPADAAALERRPAPATAAATTAPSFQPPPAAKERPAAAPRGAGGGHPLRAVVDVLVLLLVAGLAVLAAAPRRLLALVRPEWVPSVEVRVSALAVALSIGTGALVAAALG